MSGKKSDRPVLVPQLIKGSDVFAAASDDLQDAIAVQLSAHVKADGTVTIYPAKDAWIDGVERVRQTVPVEVAASYMAHVPPPFYLDRAAWDANALFCEPPFYRDTEAVAAAPVIREPVYDPFADEPVEAPPDGA